MEEAILVGVLNLTPDSFSDGGLYCTLDRALEHARQMRAEGAAYIDVGGESTRPGFTAIGVREEWERIAPVLEELRREHIPISVDTRKRELIPLALDAGASMINFQGSVREALELTRSSEFLRSEGHWVLMYNGRTDEGNEKLSPEQRRVLFFERCAEHLASRNIPAERVIFDLGIGFGTSDGEAEYLLRQQERFIRRWEHPWMLAISKKSFLKRWCSGAGAEQRLELSLALALMSYRQGCRYFRVHDVRPHRDCLRAIREIYG
ncbi:MAG: dihydropteroate synthase [Puniceicoccales bacterium]|jgi:dihydropteroate synthase|nr:dihydropteroate synthase [Puniceicoccales bacterium]